MPATKTAVVWTFPEVVTEETPFVVLYIRAGDNFGAIDAANDWARERGFERARELTLGRARRQGEPLYIARCYRLVPGEV